MYKGFYNLVSGMLTEGRRLDVISNNMANVATAGFKADRFTASTFQDVMWRRVGNMDRAYTDIGQQSYITAPSQLYTDYAQGAPDQTDLSLDFMIQGDGFFAVQTADGIAYTRAGGFSLDDDGYLCLPGFGQVLDVNEEPIQVVTDKIKSDNYGGIFNMDGGFLGRIGIFTFEDTAQLEKNDLGLFVGDGAQSTVVTVYQGMVERSNVDLVQQMVEMISSQRSYQSIAQTATMYDQLMSKATSDIASL